MRVVLSVDTEPSVAGVFSDPERRRPMLDEPVAGRVEGRSEALGFMTDELRRHGLVATFFVETVHVRAWPASPMAGHVERLMAAGQDVQLHIHPVWRSWRNGRLELENRSTDLCAKLGRNELAELMGEGREQIRRWTGMAATGVRTGNFSTAMPVFEAAADAGLHHSSNICTAAAPPPEPELVLAGGVATIAGVRELPVTCFTDRSLAARGGLRPLQINAISFAEMRDVLERMQAAGEPVAMIVTHPFDFLKRRDKQFTGMRADRMVQRRWRALCAFLNANRNRFTTTTLGQAATALADRAPPRIDGRPLLGTARAAANYLNDRL